MQHQSGHTGAALHLSATSRDQLIALAQADQPWRFIPPAAHALKTSPADHTLRLLLAANLASLALRTPARQALTAFRTIPPSCPQRDALLPQADRLERSIDTLPDDTIPPERRVEQARTNLQALASRHPKLNLPLLAWEAAAEDHEWFRAADGNIVRRRAGATLEWTRFADDRSPAAALSPTDLDPTRPVYILSIDPPHLIRRLAEILPRGADAWAAPLVIVEPDPLAFLDALAAADLTDILADERTTCLVGPSALEDLDQRLAHRSAFQIQGPVLVSAADRRDELDKLTNTISAACNRQAEEARLLRSSLALGHNERDTQWWADRIARARRPLRILIPTTRYSTYVQHAARDAAEGFRAIGAEARVLIEPDDSTRLSSLALLRQVESFDPDAVLLINYTRSTVAKDLPPDVPVVTWVQDAMLHLFSQDAWAARAPHDVLFGHPHREFFDRFNVPRAAARAAFVPASDTKFHAEPVNPELAERFACDIALATNHAETPEGLIQRFMEDAGANDAARHIVSDAVPRVQAIIESAHEAPVLPRLRDAAAQALESIGAPPADAAVARLLDQVVYPLADRLTRHQTAQWAADLARRNDWTLRIYGNGWDTHPTLAPFAAGPLPHGEELRAAYQSARVLIHASLHGIHHQRIVECAFSGGLPIARRTPDLIDTLRKHTLAAMSRDLEPSHSTLDSRAQWHFSVDHPAGLRLAAQLQRLGLKAPKRVFAADVDPESAARILPDDLQWILGDLGETTFDSPESLERIVDTARRRSRHRSSLADGIAARARKHLTYEVAAEQIIDLLRTHLTHLAEAPRARITSP